MQEPHMALDHGVVGFDTRSGAILAGSMIPVKREKRGSLSPSRLLKNSFDIRERSTSRRSRIGSE